MRLARTIRLMAALCAAVGPATFCARTMQGQSAGVLIDRVVAVVNNRAILASDLENEMQLSVLEPAENATDKPSAKDALERLISRTLIQQQIRREDEQAAEPTDNDVRSRISELRTELPACVRLHCSTAEGWSAFLAANHLSSADVETYMRLRLELLTYIENRFRQGIRISQEEIEAYYGKTLLPQYPQGQTPPSLESVSPRIEEILLEQKVNSLFNAWLDNLRKQGDIEVFDPALGATQSQGGQGGGGA